MNGSVRWVPCSQPTAGVAVVAVQATIQRPFIEIFRNGNAVQNGSRATANLASPQGSAVQVAVANTVVVLWPGKRHPTSQFVFVAETIEIMQVLR